MSDALPAGPAWPRLVGDAIKQTLRLSGRARRSELAAYLVFQVLLGGVLTFLAGFWLDRLTLDAFGLACSLLLALPLPALLSRRLHDIGFGGGWSAVFVLLALYNAALSLTALTRGAEARVAAERVMWPLDWLSIALALAGLALVLAPGSKGPNRFGPDPRDAD